MIKSHSGTRLNSQRGFLAIVAVFLIVVVGFMGIAATYLFFGNSVASGDMQQSDNALYTAESGLEIANRAVISSLITGTNKRISCAAVTGNAETTNFAAGSGKFTATTLNSSPIYVSTTLNGALTATATTVTLASTAGLAPAGTVMVDLEEMSYGGISGNSLIAVQRGFHYSWATSHATAAGVAQFQCDFDVLAGVPNLITFFAKRDLRQNISLQEAWAVGALTGTTFVFDRWNHPTELAWTVSTVTAGTAENLNDIFMLSNAEGWAVGNMNNTAFTILHWKGTSWAATPLTATCNTQTLNGVTAVSSNEAYAVGAKFNTTTCSSGNFRYTVLKWNGTAWSALTSATSPSIPADSATSANLNAVRVIGTSGNSTGNLGFAVGDGGFILQFNGTAWVKVTSPTTQNLQGIYIISATEAWAVGAAGVILKWNGTTWATVTSPTTTQLNAITMLDATQAGTAQSGWAVGNTGVAVFYNGTSWALKSSGSANNLNNVTQFNNSNDVWAVGAAGTIMHYDGTSWSAVTSGTSVALNGVSSVVRQPFASAWQENFL
jgi:Tfp pilus assembly protein PilX